VSPVVGEPTGATTGFDTDRSRPALLAADPWDSETLTDRASQTIAAYLSLTDTIAGEGGAMAGRMAQATTPEWFPAEQSAFDRYRNQGVRTVGKTLVDSLVVLHVWEPVAGGIEVDVFSCVDARGVWLIPAGAPEPPEGLMEWVMSPPDVADLPEEVPEEVRDEWFDYLEVYQPQPGVREAIVWWLRGSEVDSLVVDGSTHWDGAASCLD
jgi:hypothetical protein